MARLLLDEDVSCDVANELRRLGHDVLTVDESGRKGFADSAQLAFATADRRIFITHNRRDFIRLHRKTASHAGIVVCTRDDDDPIGLANRIHVVVTAAGLLDNQLIRVYRPMKP